MAEERIPFITLLTDFGAADPWVASLKAVLWSIQPDFRIIDLTHEVPKHDVTAGAFALYRAYRDFPPWTIHLCVVDPGVGGPRRPILVTTDDRWFLGPDNGLFSYVYERDTVSRVTHITAEHYFRKPLSPTFHARDIFAPIAANLAKGIESHRFGEPVQDFVRLPVPLDRWAGDTEIRGEVCAVDRFGNLVTNVREEMLRALVERTGAALLKVRIADQEVPLVSGGYAQQVPLFALSGSSRLMEISGNQTPAADILGIPETGAEVVVLPG